MGASAERNTLYSSLLGPFIFCRVRSVDRGIASVKKKSAYVEPNEAHVDAFLPGIFVVRARNMKGQQAIRSLRFAP